MSVFRNSLDLEELIMLAARRAPQINKYTKYLVDWFHICQTHTDGWAYWTAGSKAGNALADLIADTIAHQEVPAAAWNKAIGGIKRVAKAQLKYGNVVPVPILSD